MDTDVDEMSGETTDPPVEISLFLGESGVWVARNEDTAVASQGETRADALDNLDEAVALHRGETGESIEDEEALLGEIGIDPDEIEDARDTHDGLPEFMQ